MKGSGSFLWLAVVAFSALYVLFRIWTGFPLETNILALLPDQTEAAWVREAKARMADKVAQRVVVVVAHEEFDKAREAIRNIVDGLSGDELVQAETSVAISRVELLISDLFPYRAGLLSQTDRTHLTGGEGQLVAEKAMAQILSPFAIADGAMIRQDPFLIFPRYLAGLPGSSSKLEQKEGVLTTHAEGQHYIVATLVLNGEAFAQNFQRRFIPRFAELVSDQKTRYPKLNVLKTGAIFYADGSIRNGQKEASTFGALSIVGIILMLLFIFKGVQPIYLSLLAIGAGLACGMAASIVIFGRVHLMALVFGAGLIGISVDYAIHYCCERFSREALSAQDRLKIVAPGLTLGMISSVIGFLTLAWAPFPGLRQIAVFSAVGLVASYLTVVLVFPTLDKASMLSADTRLFSALARIRTLWQGVTSNINSMVLLAVVVAGAGAGLNFVKADDDIRKLQVLPADLRHQEAEIRQLSGLDNATQFFMISGKTTEAVLQVEEKVASELSELVAQGKLGDFSSVARTVPSQKRQTENRALLSDALLKPHLSSFLRSIGGNSEFGYQDAEPGTLTPQQLADSGGAAFLDLLILQSSDRAVVHMVSLSGVRDIPALEQIGRDREDIRFMDQGREWSSVMQIYRVRALSLLAVAVGLVWALLGFRYRPLQAAKLIAAPLVAVVSTPLILAAFGGSFTFFNAMALLLVFVIGLDYALFYAEAAEDHRDISFFANALSTLSTILAFGLMSFSQVYAVHAFGITILVGITLAFVFSPLAARNA